MKNYNEKCMLKALDEAKKGALINEIPIGTLLIYNKKIIGQSYNRTKIQITEHSEILAINKAKKHIKNYKLTNVYLYATVKPCALCFDYIKKFGIKKIIFGTINKKNKYNTKDIKIKNGILKEKCKKIIKTYFNKKRKINYFLKK